MRKITALCLAVLMLLGALTGCGGEKTPYLPTGDALHSEGTTLPSGTKPVDMTQNLKMVYDPEASLHPYETASVTNRLLFSLMYQGLFSVSGAYQAMPMLCSGYSVSRDMKTYIFYLENATFSDGTAVTAADVVASLNAARTSRVYKGRLGYVKNISVTAEGGVQVELTTAYENLPLLLDVPIFKASQVNDPRPLGTGPYYWDEQEGEIRLVRRLDWWCHAALVVTAQVIPLVAGKTNAQIRDQFEYGNVTLVCADPGSDLYVDFRGDYELWSWENGMFLYLACNEKSPVFSDRNLRKALTYAIDRDLLVEESYRNFAVAATLPAVPGSPYYNKGMASRYDYDPTILPAAVEAAGMVDQPVIILVNKADSRRARAARAIAEMLNACGLKATTSELSGDAYTKALTKGNYDLHLGQTTLSANMDLSAFYSGTGALNFGGLSDAAILMVCQEALANSGNYSTLHQMVMDDAMLCPILFRSYAIYTERGIFDELNPAKDNLFFYDLGKTLEDILIA